MSYSSAPAPKLAWCLSFLLVPPWYCKFLIGSANFFFVSNCAFLSKFIPLLSYEACDHSGRRPFFSGFPPPKSTLSLRRDSSCSCRVRRLTDSRLQGCGPFSHLDDTICQKRLCKSPAPLCPTYSGSLQQATDHSLPFPSIQRHPRCRGRSLNEVRR